MGYVRAIYVFVMRLFLVHIDRHSNILEGVRTALAAPEKQNRMLDLGAARNRVKRILLSATPGMVHIHSSGSNA